MKQTTFAARRTAAPCCTLTMQPIVLTLPLVRKNLRMMLAVKRRVCQMAIKTQFYEFACARKCFIWRSTASTQTCCPPSFHPIATHLPHH